MLLTKVRDGIVYILYPSVRLLWSGKENTQSILVDSILIKLGGKYLSKEDPEWECR